LAILNELKDRNSKAHDEMRQFEVRIGLNENVDNRVVDINGRPNVAGAGINMAQRVMSPADGSQILIGAAVYETLRHRECYMNTFREFSFVTNYLNHHLRNALSVVQDAVLLTNDEKAIKLCDDAVKRIVQVLVNTEAGLTDPSAVLLTAARVGHSSVKDNRVEHRSQLVGPDSPTGTTFT
jgi:Adenylate and Guanylate cyclase catalytic domain